uniref:T-box domain-containing protein n=1 Tax=Anopheles farauti TaxID=69004 RepID=A0A182R0G7_9DIPT
MRSVDEMATSHILSAIDPIITGTVNTPNGGGDGTVPNGATGGGGANGQGGGNGSAVVGASLLHPGSTIMGRGAGDRSLSVTLDDRDLWLRFQNLTNEMIVTKNGRYVLGRC